VLRSVCVVAVPSPRPSLGSAVMRCYLLVGFLVVFL
jgi:hypothetical protein